MKIYNNLPLFVQKCVSAKDSNRTYIRLFARLSYRDIVLSYDTAFISELLGTSVVDLNNSLTSTDLLLGVGKITPCHSFDKGIGYPADKEPVKS